MTVSVRGETEQPGAFRQVLTFQDGKVIAADIKDGGGADSAPGPHELFDASLAACKALTAHWYAKQRNFPLERVTTVIEREDAHEKDKDSPKYCLTVSMTFHGHLSDEQRARLLDVAGRCPVHKLMTSVEVMITTKAG